MRTNRHQLLCKGPHLLDSTLNDAEFIHLFLSSKYGMCYYLTSITIQTIFKKNSNHNGDVMYNTKISGLEGNTAQIVHACIQEVKRYRVYKRFLRETKIVSGILFMTKID